MKNRIIAFILTITSLFMCAFPVFANEDEELFISEVALVYKDTLDEAKAAIAGTDWKLFEKPLNVEDINVTGDGVFLIYKTTTDVEEAITDLRVMDMYGGYNSANYQHQLEDSRKEYNALINNLTLAVEEFKTLYNEGNEIAKIAYTQLNYYKDVKVSDTSDETDMLMGDFILNIPSTEAFIQVLMEGNSLVVANILSLIALGISGSADSSLATRVAEQYKNAANLTDELYYDSSTSLYDALKDLREEVLKYDELKDTVNPDSESITEEEYNFYARLAPIVYALEEIKLGEKTLCDLIRDGTYEKKDLYPIVAAFTKGQKSLVDSGLIELVLKYASPQTITQDTYDKLKELEEELKDENGNVQPVNVYLGVDRTIFEGSFAMTNAAERTQALTGESWAAQNPEDQKNKYHYIALSMLYVDAIVSGTLVTLGLISNIAAVILAQLPDVLAAVTATPVLGPFYRFIVNYFIPHFSYVIFVALGAALIAGGFAAFGKWYGYYNPNYTEIPNVMIDVRESDIGDRYVRYDAAKVYGDKDGRNADFNAYQGKEWIALYYTKDATAGNCLTPNFKYSEKDPTIQRRHQGISMFGENRAFNLNSHVYSKEAPAIYLSLRYSITKKAAAAEVPEVVGSMFTTGALYAVVALGSVGIGVGGTILAIKITEKKKAASQTENENSDN